MKKICPVCGGQKWPNVLVCKDCFNQYEEQAACTLAETGKMISFTPWAAQKIEEKVETLSRQLVAKRHEFDDFSKDIHNKAFSEIKKSLNGKRISESIFIPALKKKKDELWGNEGGHRRFAELKTLETSVAEHETLLFELEGKLKKAEHELDLISSKTECMKPAPLVELPA